MCVKNQGRELLELSTLIVKCLKHENSLIGDGSNQTALRTEWVNFFKTDLRSAVNLF